MDNRILIHWQHRPRNAPWAECWIGYVDLAQRFEAYKNPYTNSIRLFDGKELIGQFAHPDAAMSKAEAIIILERKTPSQPDPTLIQGGQRGGAYEGGLQQGPPPVQATSAKGVQSDRSQHQHDASPPHNSKGKTTVSPAGAVPPGTHQPAGESGGA